MTEAQKYQKRKNTLIILFMVLLVAFVCLICYIFIYAKKNPPMEFLDPNSIEIKQMSTADYVFDDKKEYQIIEKSNDFYVADNGEALKLTVNENGEAKILRNETEESVEILLNDANINNNIKMVYQRNEMSIILTNSGELYKLMNTAMENGQLKVGQILSENSIKGVVNMGTENEKLYIMTTENKVIDTNTLKEYNGVIKEFKNKNTTLYIYDDNSFGTEEGKIFINQQNEILTLKISFDNKVITLDGTVYEINETDGTLSTSNIGTYKSIGYRKNQDEETYKVTVLSNTGSYNFDSTYYYEAK